MWKRNYILSDAVRHVAGKLASKSAGPFTVATVVSPTILKLENIDGLNIARQHVSKSKPYRGPDPGDAQ